MVTLETAHHISHVSIEKYDYDLPLEKLCYILEQYIQFPLVDLLALKLLGTISSLF